VRVNAVLFWLLSIFFGLAAIAYAIWSMIDYANFPSELKQQQGVEWVGTVGLSLTSALTIFLGFYLQRTYKAQGGELPEDRLDADIDDGDAELGHFSPWSWWPISLAAGLALIFLGLAIGLWVALIGGAFTLVSLMGWQYEYYRGNFGR